MTAVADLTPASASARRARSCSLCPAPRSANPDRRVSTPRPRPRSERRCRANSASEADIERVGGVFDLEFLGRAAGIRIGHDAPICRPTMRASLRVRARSKSSTRGRQRRRNSALSTISSLRCLRDDAAIVGEGAVDQFRRQHHVAEGEADLALRQFDRNLRLVVLDQALHFAHRLARTITPGMPSAPLGRAYRPAPADAVGCDRAQRGGLGAAGRVQIDALR